MNDVKNLTLKILHVLRKRESQRLVAKISMTCPNFDAPTFQSVISNKENLEVLSDSDTP